MTPISVLSTKRLELVYSPWPWTFARERRREIDTHFARLREAKPQLWNGRVLMLRQFTIDDGVFRGSYFDTDFASLIAWRDWDFPDPQVKNSFAMGALRGCDGAFVLGIMAPHTANGGKIYFPAGTPDPSDIINGAVDLAGSVMREVLEETGLTSDAFVAEAGWTTILAGPRIAQIKILQAQETADVLRERILNHLRQETEPELLGVRIVRAEEDLEPTMPPFVVAFLRYVWGSPP